MQQLRFDLSDLQALVAVVEQGGFRAAATALHLSQPALSRRIAKLEQGLNVQLLVRTTRRVALTLVGREFFAKAVEILDGVERSLHQISDVSLTHFGQVTIGCVPSVAKNLLPPILQRYHAALPGIRIRVADEGAPEVLNLVQRGDADFGINFLGVDEAGIDFEPLLRERFVLACQPHHPLARRRSVSWDDIGKYPYMAVAKSAGNRKVLDATMALAEPRPVAFIEVQRVTTLLELVGAGLGIAVVPQLSMPAGAALCGVPLAAPGIERTLGIIRRAGRVFAPPVEHLYAAVKEALVAAP